MKKIIAILFLFFSLILSSQTAVGATFPGSAGVNIGSKLEAGYEPSGIIWHNRLQSLFVVWDNGYVTQMDTNGNIIHSTTYVGGDLEGITVVNDQSNYIYLLIEYPQQIVEFDISTWKKTGKIWSLQGMNGNSASGAEALTYNNEKGVFYVGSQYDGQIYVYNFDLKTAGNPNYSYKISTGITFDSSGIYYLKETKRTYAIFDTANYFQEYDNNEKLVVQYDLPGVDQEGVALLPNCPNNTATVFIAQDSGAVMKYTGYPITCAITPPVDNDGDGYARENDCNDNDKTVWNWQKYYKDVDGDGVGTGIAENFCLASPPLGYTSNPQIDCNDNDKAVSANKNYYKDADGDGLGFGAAVSYCLASPPSGFSINNLDKNDNDYDNDGVETGMDCNDKDATILANQVYYRDVDGDNLGDPKNFISVCSYQIPAGYVGNFQDLNDNDFDNDGIETNVDCDDHNMNVLGPQIYYYDADKDGLGNPNNPVSSCSLPTNYVSNNQDLNDNDHDNDGSEIGVDCNDDDATIFANQIFYRDADKDGLGDPKNFISVCSLATPTGYVTNHQDLNDNDYDNDGVETGTDCNDKDATISANQVYYRDVDGDGLGDPNNFVTLCSYQVPTGYVTNANDSNDNPVPVITVKLDGKYIYVNSQKIKIFYFTPSKSKFEIIDLDKDGLTEIVVVGLYQKKIFVPVILQIGKDGKAYVITPQKIGYAKYKALWGYAAEIITKLKSSLLN